MGVLDMERVLIIRVIAMLVITAMIVVQVHRTSPFSFLYVTSQPLSLMEMSSQYYLSETLISPGKIILLR